MLETERNIAQCYLFEEGKENKKLELTDKRLIINYKKKQMDWLLLSIKELSFNQRKLLIPIVFSGVFTPLIIAGFFSGFFHPVMALVLIISGVFAFYIGWLGYPALTVYHNTGHHDIPLSGITDNLKAFVAFFNQYRKEATPYIRAVYALVPGAISQSALIEQLNNDPNEFALYSYSQVIDHLAQGRENVKIIAIDPLQAGSELKYRRTGHSSQLFPFFQGQINPGSVIGIYTMTTFREIIELKDQMR